MSCTPNLSFLVSRVVSSLSVLFYPRQGGPSTLSARCITTVNTRTHEMNQSSPGAGCLKILAGYQVWHAVTW
ncbi:hypothetical protein BS78_10G279600 [Paspalum vaginatum]|nr:hypothetical protein BS78_10G279600 [Paspalum vaginatum]